MWEWEESDRASRNHWTLFWLLVAVQDDLLDLIAGMQSKRMDEQRVALPHLPGLLPPAQLGGEGGTTPDDTFLEMLMRCQVSLSLLYGANCELPCHW